MSHYSRPPIIRHFIQLVIWPLEAVLVAVLVGGMRLLPVSVTSSLFGWLFGKIGPLTKYHDRSARHLGFAMPELSADERERILRDMWHHLGRVAGEFPQIHNMGSEKYLTIHGGEHLLNAKDGGFIIGAHLGNWEMNMMCSSMQGQHYGLIYRPLNNPLTNWLLDMRHKRGNPDLYAKGQDAARGMMNTLKKKGFIYLFVDQKYRQGIDVNFLGHPASTPIGHVKLALKYNVPLLFMRTIRREGCHYDLYIDPPVYIYKDGKIDDEDIQAAAQMINDKLSGWIKETPEQWLWPHRRWGKDI